MRKLIQNKAIQLLACITFLSVSNISYSQGNSDSTNPVMPFIQVTMSGEAHSGCYFLSNNYGVGGPASPFILIVDNNGNVVSSKYIPGRATGFTVQETGDLTYFDEKIRHYIVLDSNLNEKRQIYAKNGYQTDNHELLMFKNGHYMFLGLQENQVNMARLVEKGDSFAMAVGALIQEYDENDNLVFEWLSYGKFNILDASGVDFTKSRIDYMHPNALAIDHDGNILLSSRSMDEITKINRETGEIIWRWGGKNNQFTFVGDTNKFYKQHCIRVLPNGNYLLFDNGNDRTLQYSRACEFKMDEEAKTVQLVWEYSKNPPIFSEFMGSVQRLDNGNTVIGWGSNLKVAGTEVTPNGDIVSEIKFGGFAGSYRVFKFDWKNAAASVRNTSDNTAAVRVYPNPSESYATVSYTVEKSGQGSIILRDITGKTVRESQIGSVSAGANITILDVASLPTGVYTVEVRIGSENFASRLVKN